MNHVVNSVHLEHVNFMPNPLHLFNKPSWPSGVLCRFMNSILEAVQLYLLRHNTGGFVLCPNHTWCHNSHCFTGSLYTILLHNEIMKADERAEYGQYGTMWELCTVFLGMDWAALSCACAVMKKPKLLPLQILKNIRYFIHGLLLFMQYALGRMCSGLY